jgi:5-methylthioadenosine/S-adenosylhomocysteine deaminase
MPVYDPVSHLVNVAGRNDVTDVWIGGERIVHSRALTSVDESAQAARAAVWQQRLR